jgi:hypothetical protein
MRLGRSRCMPSLTHFSGGDEQQSAFDWLKQRIGDIGLLRFLDYGRDTHVAVDAAEDSVGGVLYQLDTDGQMQIAAFASRASTKLRGSGAPSSRSAMLCSIVSPSLRHIC